MEVDGSVDPLIANCTFTGNISSFGAGMDCLTSAVPSLVNCVFINNTASSSGGGMCNTSASPDLINCTFTGNSSSDGGAMSDGNSTPNLYGCILWNNTTTDYASEIDQTNANVIDSDIEGGYSGTGNINANPQFVSGSNLELEPTSPCINTGNYGDIAFADAVSGITTDCAVVPRTIESTVDMGAYELQFIYVDATSFSGTDTGTSWANAYTPNSNTPNPLASALAVRSKSKTWPPSTRAVRFPSKSTYRRDNTLQAVRSIPRFNSSTM